jgi:hypothetical protein
MGEYGPASAQVDQLIRQAGRLTFDEAADLYEAHSARILIYGAESERLALASARKAAIRAGLEPEYFRARHDAVTAWRRALPEGLGPWLLVGQAIGNAAGALVVDLSLEERARQLLVGPWRQAMGGLEPVGRGVRRLTPELTR